MQARHDGQVISLYGEPYDDVGHHAYERGDICCECVCTRMSVCSPDCDIHSEMIPNQKCVNKQGMWIPGTAGHPVSVLSDMMSS